MHKIRLMITIATASGKHQPMILGFESALFPVVGMLFEHVTWDASRAVRTISSDLKDTYTLDFDDDLVSDKHFDPRILLYKGHGWGTPKEEFERTHRPPYESKGPDPAPLIDRIFPVE